MKTTQSPLLAFRVAESLAPVNRPGSYDADTQMWIGDTVGAQGSGGGESSGGVYSQVDTTTASSSSSDTDQSTD